MEDIEGNVYNTVKIGTQEWMVENLKVTKYNDGLNIPLVEGNNKWKNIKTPAYCWYNNDIANKEKYGALYNWYAVDTKKLAPIGWHVPTDEEWNTLASILVDHANRINKVCLYKGDFSALPGGYRSNDGNFNYQSNNGYWWSATENGAAYAWYRHLYCWYRYLYCGNDGNDYLGRYNYYESCGFSVRLVRDLN